MRNVHATRVFKKTLNEQSLDCTTTEHRIVAIKAAKQAVQKALGHFENNNIYYYVCRDALYSFLVAGDIRIRVVIRNRDDLKHFLRPTSAAALINENRRQAEVIKTQAKEIARLHKLLGTTKQRERDD